MIIITTETESTHHRIHRRVLKDVIHHLTARDTIAAPKHHHVILLLTARDTIAAPNHHQIVYFVLTDLVKIAALAIHHQLVNQSVVTVVLNHQEKNATNSANLLAAVVRAVKEEVKEEKEDITPVITVSMMMMITLVLVMMVSTEMMMVSTDTTEDTEDSVEREERVDSVMVEKVEKEERVDTTVDTKFVNSSVNLLFTMIKLSFTENENVIVVSRYIFSFLWNTVL